MSRFTWLVGVLVAILVLVPAIWLIRPALMDTVVSEPLPVPPVTATQEHSEPIVPTPPKTPVPVLATTPPVTPPTTTPIPEELPVTATPKEAQGIFEGRAGHEGKGTVRFITVGEERFVRFEDDFFVTNGPDVRVYLGRGGVYAPETFLGDLKGNKGSQNYKIPEGIDPGTFNEVWIWCRAFSVPMASAVLVQ